MRYQRKFVYSEATSVPYKVQGLIHFTCRCYDRMAKKEKELIDRLCKEVAGDDAPALFEFMTNEYVNVTSVSLKYFISEKKLYLLRKRFCEKWYEDYRQRKSN